MTTIALFGDSMLGRYTKPRIDQLEAEIGPDALVVNCAAGGWSSTDGLRRAPLVARLKPEVVVLSFGANDCRPDRLVPLDRFTANLDAIVAAFAPAVPVAFLPPSILEQDGIGRAGRTNAVLDTYRAALAATGLAVDTDAALAPLVARGVPVHEDGLHLTGQAYELVTTALAAQVSAAAAQRGLDPIR